MPSGTHLIRMSAAKQRDGICGLDKQLDQRYIPTQVDLSHPRYSKEIEMGKLNDYVRISPTALAGIISSILAALGSQPLDAQNCANQQCQFNGVIYTCNAGAGQICSNGSDAKSCTDNSCPPPGARSLNVRGRSNSIYGPAGAFHLDAAMAAQWRECTSSPTSKQAPPVKDQLGEAEGTRMTLLNRLLEGPVTLEQGVFGIDDLLKGGKILNRSDAEVIAYKIGWVMQDRDGSTSVLSGIWVPVSAGLLSGRSLEIPAQNITAASSNIKSTAEIGFYVAEVRFRNGKRWKATTASVKSAIRHTEQPSSTATVLQKKSSGV